MGAAVGVIAGVFEAIGRLVAAAVWVGKAVALARSKDDGGTRELFERHLVGEEAHADWIEQQQHLVSTVGIENYLAQQIGTD